MAGFLKNKYAVTTAIFIVWVSVFSEVDALFMIQRKWELSSKKKELAHYEKMTADAAEALDELILGNKLKEKFAREQYLMKKDSEDVYLFREN